MIFRHHYPREPPRLRSVMIIIPIHNLVKKLNLMEVSYKSRAPSSASDGVPPAFCWRVSCSASRFCIYDIDLLCSITRCTRRVISQGSHKSLCRPKRLRLGFFPNLCVRYSAFVATLFFLSHNRNNGRDGWRKGSDGCCPWWILIIPKISSRYHFLQ